MSLRLCVRRLSVIQFTIGRLKETIGSMGSVHLWLTFHDTFRLTGVRLINICGQLFNIMAAPTHSHRHQIVDRGTLNEPIYMDGLPLRIVLRFNCISMGCSDIEPSVLKYVLKMYEQKFGKDEEQILQSGSHPC